MPTKAYQQTKKIKSLRKSLPPLEIQRPLQYGLNIAAACLLASTEVQCLGSLQDTVFCMHASTRIHQILLQLPQSLLTNIHCSTFSKFKGKKSEYIVQSVSTACATVLHSSSVGKAIYSNILPQLQVQHNINNSSHIIHVQLNHTKKNNKLLY